MVGIVKALVRMGRFAVPLLISGAAFLVACGNPVAGNARDDRASRPEEPAGASATAPLGKAVTPPFPVAGDLEGLLLVWFDQDGPHTAKRRSEIPEARRALVRVDSLSLPPEQRLAPDKVYVANVTKSGVGYPVFEVAREQFDQMVDAATGPVATAGPVVLYKTSWCGACKAAEAHLKQRGIDYDAHDIEKDPAAQKEMASKVVAAGKRPGGVPVIDVGGELMMGFDRESLDRLIDQKGLAL